MSTLSQSVPEAIIINPDRFVNRFDRDQFTFIPRYRGLRKLICGQCLVGRHTKGCSTGNCGCIHHSVEVLHMWGKA